MRSSVNGLRLTATASATIVAIAMFFSRDAAPQICHLRAHHLVCNCARRAHIVNRSGHRCAAGEAHIAPRYLIRIDQREHDPCDVQTSDLDWIGADIARADATGHVAALLRGPRRHCRARSERAGDESARNASESLSLWGVRRDIRCRDRGAGGRTARPHGVTPPASLDCA
jgi:hypothetical protein